jgi:polyhydroxybutyrate depolymerase
MRSPLLVGLAMFAMAAVACDRIGTSSPDSSDRSSEPSQALLTTVRFPSSTDDSERPVNPQEARTPCRSVPTEGSPGASVRRSIDTKDGSREYLVYRPSGPSSDTPLPLILNFHGRGSDAETQERYSGLVPVAERVGFIVVSPEGTGSPRGWSAGATTASQVDDVEFVRHLLASIEGEQCVDASRIYATGFSNGAFMASKLACRMGDRIAAFAAVAGVHGGGEACVRAVPALAIHGTKDDLVPFEQGTVRQAYTYLGARAETRAWAALNGCSSAVVSERLSPNVTRESYTTGKAPVVLYVLSGGGHTWPGASDIPGLGPTIREVNAAETIWAFFSSYRRAV